MKKGATGFIGILAFTLVCAASVQAELVRNPTQVGTSIDLGQIKSGTIYSDAPKFDAENQVLTRTGVYLTESGVYNDRLTVRLTIGGLFWFALPEGSTFQTKLIKFGPGVGQAQGVYAFGEDPRNPVATLQFGLFPHKYSESVNLGEYLYRSGTYPGILYSGGWSYINAASYLAQGLRLSVPLFGGKLVNDLTVYMERDIEPNHDLSPGYMLTAKPLPFIEVGAGAVWSHAITWRKETGETGISPHRTATSPVGMDNAYSKSTGMPVYSAGGANVPPSSPCGDSLAIGKTSSDCGYYTFRGFKTMGRVSLDLGMLTGLDIIRPGDFKVYSEIALLGVEDQPYYYEDKTERMPVMVGVNVPTFGVLDRLAFEGEYHKSRFPNTFGSTFEQNLPIPVPSGGDGYNIPSELKESPWKWTAYARRTLVDGVTLYAQAANDHMRHFDFTAKPSPVPATLKSSDWYYVFRLEVGI
jgi:hypothetical protein